MNRVIFESVLDGVFVDRIIRDNEFSMPSMHFHPEYEIYYLLDGARYYFIENKTYPINKGSLVLVDAMQIHRTSASGKAAHDRFLIELAEEPFSSCLSEFCGLKPGGFFAEHAGVWTLDADGQRTVEGLLGAIADECRGQKAYHQNLVMMKIAELLLFVARLKAGGRAGPGASLSRTTKHIQVHGVTEYISEHYNQSLSLDEICRRFYVSKSYLCRIFKEVTGFTVYEYIHMRRVKHAQELLENSDVSVAQIAALLGYGTVTHFERMFRKYTETTPLKYRKKMRLIRQRARERKAEKDLAKQGIDGAENL
ncbi:MAG: AraC family transcriptional regulator [Oscillospiraceae bacterium]|nr:AraC family transcriptional regulator [Oscillospiraceae bacterium]